MEELSAKKEVFEIKAIPYNSISIPNVARADEFRQQDTACNACKEYESGAIDLDQVIARDYRNIDLFYVPGMVYKAMQLKEKALAAFRHELELISGQPEADKARNAMLQRLALGQINAIVHGYWNQEKEIWQRIL